VRLPFRRARRVPALPAYADDGTLVTVAANADPARADSDALAGVDLSAPLLVRHRLVGLPDEAAVERARELLAQEGYALTVLDGPPYDVRAWRTQVLSPLSAAQERSRMAGLAQRLGGDVAGWDALAPATSSEALVRGLAPGP
jgi:Regulator of ribonuclease activity B